MILFYGALALYVVGTLAYLLLLSVKGGPLARLATAATVGGFVLHTGDLLVRLVAVGHPPPGSPYEALSVFAWVTVLIYLGLELRFRRKIMGAFVLPIVLLTPPPRRPPSRREQSYPRPWRALGSGCMSR